MNTKKTEYFMIVLSMILMFIIFLIFIQAKRNEIEIGKEYKKPERIRETKYQILIQPVQQQQELITPRKI